MLEIFMVTYITTELGAFVHCMLLQLNHGLPDYDILTILPALVRKLAEVNAVAKNLVDWLQEVTALLALWAAHFKTWSGVFTANHVLFAIHTGSVLLSL